MLKVVLDATDDELMNGLHINEIYARAHANEPRVNKGNLRQILYRMDSMQVDDDGRGLIITFDQSKDNVSVVDKQLLYYRKYSTVSWPWAELIAQADTSPTAYDEDV